MSRRFSWMVAAGALIGMSAARAQQQTPTTARTTPADPQRLIQRTPMQQLQQVYLSGFHYAASNPGEQMEANHYCQKVSEEFIECAIFDANGNLHGTEHIVSRRIFEGLPREEQRLWHPHTYEVKSGVLVAPGMPPQDEHKLMEQLVSTYGKTWDVFPRHPAPLPTGQARLMKGFTADGQLQPEILAERDRRFGISSQEIRERRKDIPDPGFNPVVLEMGPPPKAQARTPAPRR